MKSDLKLFHRKYVRNTPWWRCFTAEYKMVAFHCEPTSVVGFDYDDEFVNIRKSGHITVKPGFVFGASGPTLDRFFGFFRKRMRKIRRGVCFHDAGYYMSRKGVFVGPKSKIVKESFDNMFGDMMIADDVWDIRADTWEDAVKLAGDFSWEKDLKK